MSAFLLFNLAVIVALMIDLGVINKKAQAPTVRQAALWSLAWISLAVAFGAGVWGVQGAEHGTRWFTAYIMEKSLNVDNLFVFSLIFAYFHIPSKFQHKCLVYGVIGVALLRGLLITAGIQAVTSFHWLLYLFGAFLVYAGVTMFRSNDDDNEVENSWAVRIAKHLVPYLPQQILDGKFFVRRVIISYSGAKIPLVGGPYTQLPIKTYATRLLVCLFAIEIADVLFAVDSIPVVVSVTQNFFLAYTSNIMAILGLRSLYFLLDHLLHRLAYLPYALGLILAFIGTKMLIEPWLPISQLHSLAVVFGLLAGATVLSILTTKEKARA